MQRLSVLPQSVDSTQMTLIVRAASSGADGLFGIEFLDEHNRIRSFVTLTQHHLEQGLQVMVPTAAIRVAGCRWHVWGRNDGSW